MANYANLKSDIAGVIRTNNNEEITGDILQEQLLGMVDSLGAGFQYKGVATPTTAPGTPDENVFYIASTAGTYTNFGSLVVADGEVAILKYNGSWAKEVTGAATAAQVTQLGRDLEGLGLYFEGDTLTLNAPADGVMRSFLCNIPANTDFNLSEVSGKYWNSGIQVAFYSGSTSLLDTGRTYTRTTVTATHNFASVCDRIDIKVWAGSNTDCVFSLPNPSDIPTQISGLESGLEKVKIMLDTPIGIIDASTYLGGSDVYLAAFSNLNIRTFYLDIKELNTSSVFIAINFANSSTVYSEVSAYSGYHSFQDTVTKIAIYANHNRPTDELVVIRAVLYENSDKSLETTEPNSFDYKEIALNLSCGIDADAKANGTSKYDEIRSASSNSSMDDECCAILYNLRKCSYDRRIPYGYFLDWESQNRYVNNQENYCKQSGGVWIPKSLNEIDLTDATLSQLAGGPAPSMNLQDFYTCIGNDFESDNHEKNRAALVGTVKKTWAESKVLQMFSWHLENPYAPVGYSQMKCRYSDSHNVVNEILNNTGSACGFSSDYPDGQFSNPKEWFDYRCSEVAELIKELVDENNEYIPILLRLWHEMEDGWAWWQLGRGVSLANYKAFFQYTVEKINQLANTNKIIIVFNTDKNILRPAQDTLADYVPLKYVDIISFDYYNFEISSGELLNAMSYAREFVAFAEKNGKVCAIAETGGSSNKVNFFADLAKLINAPGVRFGFLNTWITSSTWLPSESTTIKNAFAKLVKRQNLYNIGTMPDMTEINP